MQYKHAQIPRTSSTCVWRCLHAFKRFCQVAYVRIAQFPDNFSEYKIGIQLTNFNKQISTNFNLALTIYT